MRVAQPKLRKARISSSTLALGLTVGLLAAVAPHLALAASSSTGGGLPYEGPLTQLQHSVSGPLAYSLSLLGVAGVGGSLIFGGDLNAFLRGGIMLVCFIGLLISAPATLSALSGAGAVVALAAPLLGQLA